MNAVANIAPPCEHTIIEQFRVAMAEQGIVTSDSVEADGSIHRFHVEGDRKGSKNGWYILHIDERPAGAFGCCKRHGVGTKFSWSAKCPAKPLTREERREYAEKMARQKAERDAAEAARHAAAASRAQAIWDAAEPATDDHPYLQRKGVGAHGLRIGKWEVTNPETGEIRVLTDNALLVPFCDRTRALHSLQAILPKKMLGGGTRDKDFLKHGAKLGYFYAIGKPQELEGRKVFIVCEGYATGASIHEASGHCVLTAFDISNLAPVAASIRERQPDAIILFAADNDRWVTEPINNPGVHHARKAAQAVNGLVAIPQFANIEGKPTDFNDLFMRQGLAAVAAQINAALAASTVSADLEEAGAKASSDVVPARTGSVGAAVFEEEPEAIASIWPSNALQVQATQVPSTIDQQGEVVSPTADDLAHNQYFTILGTNRKSYFFFQHEKRQVLEYTKSEFTDAGLIELAALNWWEMKFPGRNGGINKNAVVEGIFRVANQSGIYSPDSVRGRGVWIDNGRIVFHLGDQAIIDGNLVDLAALIRSSRYVYEAGERLAYSGDCMLTDEEGAELLETARLFSWAERGAGILMAGWTFLAPICGALEWRPHIWLAGPAGTGKSTLQRAYMQNLIGESWGIYANGSSSEAGIRQEIGSDARPVIVDEAETSADARSHMENVLTLIRQSSSEGGTMTLKGTTSGKALSYQVRSMFCLAAVAPSLTRDTDMDRLTRLELKKSGDWKTNGLCERLSKMDADETLSNRVFARAMHMLPVVRKAAKVFSAAAGDKFGRQRDGDQFGALLAGAWCLKNNYVPSANEALAMINACDWSSMGAGQAVEKDDAKEALSTLLSAHIRVDNRPYSVAQLIEIAAAGQPAYCDHVTPTQPTFAQSVQALGLHGIRVFDSSAKLPEGCAGRQVVFCNGHRELIELVDGTDYAIDLIGRLSRIEGAVKSKEGKPGAKVRFASGQPKRYLAIPMEAITGVVDDEELPI